MKALQIKSETTLEDLIFANRNKAYGAYFLRQVYNKTLGRSAVLGISIIGLSLIGPTIYANLKPAEEIRKIVLVDPTALPPPPIEKNTPPPTPPPPPEMKAPPTTKFFPPEIQPNDKVTDEEPPPTQDQLDKAPAGGETTKGDPDANEQVVDPSDAPKDEPVEVKPEVVDIFISVEQQPEFLGGAAKMYQYLGKNIKYPSAAQRANVTGKVFLTFVVNTDGSIVNVETLKGIGFGCDEEAIRVVKTMPKWNPGKQFGRAVRVKYTLPISFSLE